MIRCYGQDRLAFSDAILLHMLLSANGYVGDTRQFSLSPNGNFQNGSL